MKKLLLVLGSAIWLSALAACTVGVDPGGGGGDTCEPLSCGQALMGGLSAQGDALCDPTSESIYEAVLACACDGAGACADVCGDNLCVDLGETGACGDCLNDNCPQEHTDCASD